jgi:hypothetical protein
MEVIIYGLIPLPERTSLLWQGSKAWPVYPSDESSFEEEYEY